MLKKTSKVAIDRPISLRDAEKVPLRMSLHSGFPGRRTSSNEVRWKGYCRQKIHPDHWKAKIGRRGMIITNTKEILFPAVCGLKTDFLEISHSVLWLNRIPTIKIQLDRGIALKVHEGDRVWFDKHSVVLEIETILCDYFTHVRTK